MYFILMNEPKKKLCMKSKGEAKKKNGLQKHFDYPFGAT